MPQPAFDSFTALLQMSGHGQYVWLAWGLCTVLLASLVVLPWLKHRRILRQLSTQKNRRRE